MTELRSNADFSKLQNDHPARAYKNIQNRLPIDRDEQGNEVMLKDSQKIVVPKGAQDEILKELHRSHSGILKTYTTAVQLYHWPGMKNSIKQMIELRGSCGSCQRDRPSKQRTTIYISPPSKAQSPMKHVAADLFDAAGEKWIVLVDRYSGYAWTDKLRDTSTASHSKAKRLVRQIRLPRVHTYRRRSAIPKRLQSLLQQALHYSRAKLAVQLRVKRPGRSSSEKHEKSHPTLC